MVSFQQLQIFGNYQYLLQDVCITLLVCLTSKQLTLLLCPPPQYQGLRGQSLKGCVWAGRVFSVPAFRGTMGRVC